MDPHDLARAAQPFSVAAVESDLEVDRATPQPVGHGRARQYEHAALTEVGDSSTLGMVGAAEADRTLGNDSCVAAALEQCSRCVAHGPPGRCRGKTTVDPRGAKLDPAVSVAPASPTPP